MTAALALLLAVSRGARLVVLLLVLALAAAFHHLPAALFALLVYRLLQRLGPHRHDDR